MNEYVVKWRHLRYGPGFDGQVEAVKLHRLTPTRMTRLHNRLQRWNDWRTTRAWNEMCLSYSQHGGKTECRIYEVGVPVYGETPLWCVANAEAVCSWRDQFDRRVGRLYSLALALCEMKAPWETYFNLLVKAFPIAGKNDLGDCYDALVVALGMHDKPAVKCICAEIVKEWKGARNAQVSL